MKTQIIIIIIQRQTYNVWLTNIVYFISSAEKTEGDPFNMDSLTYLHFLMNKFIEYYENKFNDICEHLTFELKIEAIQNFLNHPHE